MFKAQVRGGAEAGMQLKYGEHRPAPHGRVRILVSLEHLGNGWAWSAVACWSHGPGAASMSSLVRGPGISQLP